MILAELYNLYQRLSESGEGIVPAFGWTYVKVAWELDIDDNGRLLSIIPLTSGSRKGARASVELVVPQDEQRTSNVMAYFLRDNAQYLLGIDHDPDGEPSARTIRSHAASMRLHEEVLRGVDSPASQAVLKFLSSEPDHELIRTAEGRKFLEGGFAVIRLSGDCRYLHERPEMAAAWEAFLEVRLHEAPLGTCLVTGERSHLARTFPPVSGIPGAQSAGASLVSFNREVFESYGAKQAYNSPISKQVAHGAGEALKYLLRDDRHHADIGSKSINNTSIIFWADRSAEQEDALLLRLFDGALPAEDSCTVEMIKATFSDIQRGRSLQGFDPETQYFIVGISPNVGRLAVWFFYSDTLGSIASNYGQYLRDISMDGQGQSSLGTLLLQTAPLSKRKNDERKNIPSALLKRCYEAMLCGGRFPASLLYAVLSRMRADHGSNNKLDMGQRASLIKACLLRMWRYGGQEDREGDLTMALNRENDNTGYLLGRLFAVMERAQSAGIGETNATIRDRYIGAAAATPARVFPQLFRGLQNSLTAAHKRNAGLCFLLERELDEIVGCQLSGAASLPATLDLEGQGEFYVGYYQERVDLWKPRSQRGTEAMDDNTEE